MNLGKEAIGKIILFAVIAVGSILVKAGIWTDDDLHKYASAFTLWASGGALVIGAWVYQWLRDRFWDKKLFVAMASDTKLSPADLDRKVSANDVSKPLTTHDVPTVVPKSTGLVFALALGLGVMLMFVSGCTGEAAYQQFRTQAVASQDEVHKDYVNWANAIAMEPGYKIDDLSGYSPEARKAWLKMKMTPIEQWDKWAAEEKARADSGGFLGLFGKKSAASTP